MAHNKKKHNSAVKIPTFIKLTAKVLETVAPGLAVTFMVKLFTTPRRFKLPKREQEMERTTRQEKIKIAGINKIINVYLWGEGPKRVLLVHGWSGRGTQLHSIAARLLKNGYSTVSFDAPAHGKSGGKTSEMTEFVACILQLEKQYGPFEHAIGHSLGAMAVLNAVKNGLAVNKAVIIGSGDIIKDIMDGFTKNLGMKIATGTKMIQRFEKKFGETINNYSAYIAAQAVNNPVLVLHDKDDNDVPVSAAHNISRHLKNHQLVITEGLGHRKILGDKTVIKTIIEFLQ